MADPDRYDDDSNAVYYVYMVKCGNGAYYTGQTADIGRRITQHKTGEGARYTARHPPIELVWAEAHRTRGDAMRRENDLKDLTHGQKADLADTTSIDAASDLNLPARG